MDGRPTWTDCDEAGGYFVPNVLSPRYLVFRPDIMDETVPHTYMVKKNFKNLLLRNRRIDFHETWYEALGTPAHNSLNK